MPNNLILEYRSTIRSLASETATLSGFYSLYEQTHRPNEKPKFDRSMKTLVSVFILPCFALFSMVGFSQDLDEGSQLVHSENGVSIFSESQDCIDGSKGTAVQYIMLRVKNGNSSQTKISFDKELWHAGKCSTCNTNSPEHHVEIIVPANSELKGSCDKEQRGLMIYMRMIELKNVRSLTHFELKNIQIEVID